MRHAIRTFVRQPGFTFAALLTLTGIALEMADHRAEHPAEDLMTALVQAEVDGERLLPEEIGAFLVCLLPTSWVFTVKRFADVRLPASYYRLRAWETRTRLYERLGVRIYQRLLRFPLLAILNRDIARRFCERDYAGAEREMRFAETSHGTSIRPLPRAMLSGPPRPAPLPIVPA